MDSEEPFDSAVHRQAGPGAEGIHQADDPEVKVSGAQVDFLPEIIDRIVEAVNPLRIILFGSVARGDAGPDSDIDLLVILNEITDRKVQRVAIRQLLAGLPVPKDILVATPAEVARSEWRIGSIL